jgi:hypothetical protein
MSCVSRAYCLKAFMYGEETAQDRNSSRTSYFIAFSGIKGHTASVYCILNLRGTDFRSMKRLVLACFFLIAALTASAQHGNEWVQYGQPYFKIPVGRNGFYKITYSGLQEAGLTGSPDPKTFQLFHRGAEQAIRVAGEDDGVFDARDHIEFFATANDGTLDSTLYGSPAYQPHRHYNLFSDTTSFFLTYGSKNGKRMELYTGSSSGLLEETYHTAEKLLVLKETYSGGVDYGDVKYTYFDEGEGWMGVQILHNQEVTYSIEGLTQAVTPAGKPLIEILLTGRGPMTHAVELYAGSRLLTTVSFQGYKSYKHIQEIEWSDVSGDDKVSIKVRVTGAGGPDRVSAGYIRLLFPQRTTMEGVAERLFLLPQKESGVLFLKIQNASTGTRVFDVTDLASVVEIATEESTTLNAVVPAATSPRKVFATSQILTATNIKPVTFREIRPDLHNYIIITHPSLRQPALGYLDPIKAYAEYRSLPEGGGFDTLILNIDQLYDQFNYGERSPRAIYQFMKYFASVKMPDYLFLIGKGLSVNYGYWRNPSAFTQYNDLVPTAGYPASDMAFSAGLGGTPHVPAVPTGRLTAVSAAEVAAYFNKVKERDNLPFSDLTRKNILHLSGGIEESEPAAFRAIMQGFETVAETFYLGGQVKAVSKQSTDTKVVNIAEEVNNGLGLITFFGHSAPNTQDFDIGLVTDPIMEYNNPGKYPFMLMNGCDAGSFFLNSTIFGENWVKTTNKGAIGFIAHSSYGLVYALQRYSDLFYQVGFGDSAFIKQGVGKVQQEVAKRYVANYGSSAVNISQVQQMLLLGDPAVRLFGAEKPDYALDGNSIYVSSFQEEPITAYTDSFAIHIPVQNFGIAHEKKLRVEVTRQFNDQPPVRYDSIFSALLFSDTLTLMIHNSDKSGFGINVFSIVVDADDFIDELSESNNSATFELFIPSNGTRNLFPYNYSIVRATEVDLSFQYTDLIAEERDYLLDIDTTLTFDSGFGKQYRLTTALLGKQRVKLLDRDTLVYYWRTKIAEPLENESNTWTVNSFTYINNGPEGWAQVSFPQYEANPAAGLLKDAVIERLRFEESISDIAIKTFSTASGQPRDSVSFKINGVEFNLLTEGGACRDNTINLVAFDRKSTRPYAGLYFKWYELLYEYGGRRLLCGREPYVINSFTPGELVTGNQDDLIEYVENIQTGDSVVLFNIGDAGFDQWPDEAKLKLADLGISLPQLADLRNGDPVVIFSRKGSAVGSAKMFHGPAPQTSVKVNETIAGRFTSGTMTSVRIGPAQRWEEFIVKVAEVEPVDDFNFAIIGIRADGAADTLKTNITASEDLSAISAIDYPYLKIVYKTSDDINLSATQLSKWLVTYEPLAEGLVFYRGPRTAQVRLEGEAFSADFGFVNVSDKLFPDSLTVRYDLFNYQNLKKSQATTRIASPLPGDTTLFSLSFNTRAKEGWNDVEVFVNPHVEMEKTYDNNVIVLPRHLQVLADNLHPVMDVTFDGRYLENNEYVSANPVIRIRLWDENPFIRKADTLGVAIYLAFPCSPEPCSFERIYFSRNDVTWEPATDGTDFTVRFSPQNLADGTYTLRVEAGDAEQNPSRVIPYQISFMVAHEPVITLTAPHPNPFYMETSIQLVVSGDGLTTWLYTLQIFNVNGTLVRELSDQSQGLSVGNNRIGWDGSGSDGRSMPDGIYLYRLQVGDRGKKREYHGKMILRR